MGDFISGYGLINLVDRNEPVKCLEIGCQYGNTSLHLLRNLPYLTLYCVDPYTYYVDWDGSEVNHDDHAYSVIIDRCKVYGNRFNIIKKRSDDAVCLFEDDFFDMIFIDGLHTYDQVKADCNNYYSKLKTGGVFSGHDYNIIEGVKRAVDEFADKCNKKVQFTNNDVWYFYK